MSQRTFWDGYMRAIDYIRMWRKDPPWPRVHPDHVDGVQAASLTMSRARMFSAYRGVTP